MDKIHCVLVSLWLVFLLSNHEDAKGAKSEFVIGLIAPVNRPGGQTSETLILRGAD